MRMRSLISAHAAAGALATGIVAVLFSTAAWAVERAEDPAANGAYDGTSAHRNSANVPVPVAQIDTEDRDTVHGIVGGQVARPGEWPWQVHLSYRRNDGSWAGFCGGSVVAPRWVLTAAHCVVDKAGRIRPASRLGVRVDTQRRGRGGRVIRVAAVHPHSGYGAKLNDIALLKLARPARVKAVELPDAARLAAIAPPGTVATVTGWGTRRFGVRDVPDRLLEVEVPMVGERACRSAYPGRIRHGMLCAGLPEGGKDSCQGDSGGPLVVRDGKRWMQVGVVSWGAGCGDPGKYGVYADTGAFATWIQRISDRAIPIVGMPPAPKPVGKPPPPKPVATTPPPKPVATPPPPKPVATPRPPKPVATPPPPKPVAIPSITAGPPVPQPATPQPVALSERARKLARLLGRDFSPHARDGKAGWTDLHYAAALDLPGLARRLLDAGIPVDVRLKDGEKPLGKRVHGILGKFGQPLVPASNPSLKPPTSGSNTPLHWAARGNALKTARLLVERGADIHAKDDVAGRTPLYFAAIWNAFETARFLFVRGADVNAKSTMYGETPLHSAAMGNAVKVARFLVEQGAHIHEKDKNGRTPVLWAAFGAPETFHWLVDRGADFQAKDKTWGNHALHYAARANAPEIAGWLIERRVDVNVRNKSGRTPLHHAALKRAPETARLLIKHGAKLNATNSEGRTPLHDASEFDAIDVARLLVKHGADIHAKASKDGNTALHYAARLYDPDIARLLIEGRADVNVRNKKGWSPLHETAYMNTVNVAQVLFESDANVNAQSNDGQTPLHVASSRNVSIVARLLIERGVRLRARDKSGDTALHHAARANALEVARLLVKHRADVTVRNKSGWSPLHKAAQKNALKAARLLIESNANMEARSNHGHTPLHVASLFQAYAVAQLLIERGVKLHARDNDGDTALHLAAGYCRPRIVRLLVGRNAEPNATNIEGRTPYDVVDKWRKKTCRNAETRASMQELLRSLGGTCKENC